MQEGSRDNPSLGHRNGLPKMADFENAQVFTGAGLDEKRVITKGIPRAP